MVTVHVIDLIPSVVWNLLPAIPTSPYITWLLVSLHRRQIMILVPFQIRQCKVLFTLTFLPLQKSKLKSKCCQIREPMDSISGVLMWNSIPLSIKTLLKNQFKRELQGKLFEILEKEDDYIRISDIRVQFSKS